MIHHPASRDHVTRLLRIACAAMLLVIVLPAPGASLSPRWLGTALADSEDFATLRAREHYARGERLFAMGHFRDAKTAYEAAYHAKALPGLLFNIGQCYRNLGDYASAVFVFRQYLQRQPDASNGDAVRALIGQMEADMRALELKQDTRSTPEDPARRPLWNERWWLLAGVVTLAVSATVTTALLTRDGNEIPDSDLGNLDFEHDQTVHSPYRRGVVVVGVGHGLRW